MNEQPVTTKPPKPAPGLARYRWAVASRTLAAVGGGYLVAMATAAGVGLALHRGGVARVDAVLTATMLAFIAAPMAAIWAFCSATAKSAWLGVMAPAFALGALAWFLSGAVA